MSIARVLKTDIILPKDNESSLIKYLEESKLIHISDIHDSIKEKAEYIEERTDVDSSEVDEILGNSKWILDTFRNFDPEKKGLLEEFFGSAPYIEADKFNDIIKSFKINEYTENLKSEFRDYEEAAGEIEKNKELIKSLTPWTQLKENLSLYQESEYVSVILIACKNEQYKKVTVLLKEKELEGYTEWVVVSENKKDKLGYFIVLNEKRDDLENIIKISGSQVVTLPCFDSTVEEIEAESVKIIKTSEEKKEKISKFFAVESLKKREIIKAFYDEYSNRKKNITVRNKMFYSRMVLVVHGWVKQSNKKDFKNLIDKNFPDAVLRFSKPAKDDNPPVELENPKLIKPYQTLLEMFGMPNYFGIDPTPIVAITMTVFFGICVGDAGYGTLQVLLILFLKRKFKPDPGTRLFLNMFLQMGIMVMIFGTLSWSFFGFSPGYVHGGPKILGILPFFLPTKDIMTVIGLSIVLGVITQLASILAGLINSIKMHDIEAAIFDYLMWFIMLSSITGWVFTKIISSIPKPFETTFLLLIALSAFAVVIFSGRENKNIFSRLLSGVISLYGIVGFYGIVSFFSDVLSYMRLAIIDMTTGFIALVANLMGGLLMGSGSLLFTLVTIVIGVIIAIFFHILNLFLSMLSAFVHSLRLNYLESFSRYYPGGGKPFIPFKRESQHYRFEK
ncbi:MAG: hypothetical protein GXP33_05470 [Spirochaetes bacterium]|nr:hypothetical protein [Spirochaetota bacterium]